MDYINEMDNLVASIDVKEYKGQIVVSSREVANNFEKQHKHVLECIENLKEGVAEKSADLFIESKYQHPQNKQYYKEYLLTRDGFSLLVMGFTGQKALEWKLKYIDAFNKMEQYIKQQTQNMYLSELKKVSARLEKIEDKINTSNMIEISVSSVSDSDYKNNLRYGLAIQMNELNQREKELNSELINIQEKKNEIRRIYAQL